MAKEEKVAEEEEEIEKRARENFATMAFFRNRQYVTFGLVWITYCIAYFLRKPIGIVKPELEVELSLSKTQLGWIDLAFLLPYSGVQIALSSMWDRTSPKHLIAGCLTLASCAMISMGFFDMLWPICICLFISGAAQAPLWPACTKVLSLWFPEDRLSSVFGTVSTAPYVGALAGTGLAIFIQNRFGWQWVFVPSGFAGIVIALIVFIFIAVPKDEDSIGTPIKTVAKSESGKALGSFASLWAIPAVPDLTVAVFGLKFVRYCMHMWLPLYLIEYLKYSKTDGGIFSTMFDVGGILGGPLLGVLVDHWCPKRPLWGIYLALMLGTIVFGLMACIASWGIIYCSVLLLLAGATNCGPDSLLTGSVTMMVGEKYGQNQGAGVTSLVNGIGSIGAIIEGPVIGLVSQHVGWNGVIWLMIVISFFSMISTLKAFLILKLGTPASAGRSWPRRTTRSSKTRSPEAPPKKYRSREETAWRA